MTYREKRYLNASFLKEIIDKEITLDLLEEEWNKTKTSEALDYGTKVHEYLLEGKENDLIERYSDLKPFIDIIPGKREIELYTTLEGVKCKCKIDILGSHSVMDLKTTSNINNIADAIEKYNYNLQLAFYELMANVDKSSLIFVSKKAKRNHLFLFRMPNLFREKEQILDFLTINKKVLNKFFKGK